MNPAFWLLALLAEVLGTIGGFGSSVFFVPVAQLYFDFQTVLAITSLLHVFSNSAKVAMFFRTINLRLLLLIGIPSVLFVIAGAYLSTIVQSAYTTLALGIFLIIISALLLLFSRLKIRPTSTNALFGGGLAGFFAGFVGTGGAIRGMVLAAFSLEKNVFIGTSAAIDLGVDCSRSGVYLLHHYLTPTYYIYIPFLFLVAVIGSYVGKRLVSIIPQQGFRLIVLVLIFLTGVGMVYQYWTTPS